ncbi:hypothetical protein CR513_53204, partial [Mucuna pruriens]
MCLPSNLIEKYSWGSTAIYCDNTSTIKLSKNSILHGRNKHINVRHHFLCDLTKEKVVEIIYYKSEDQVAELFTKPFKLAIF